MPIEISLAAVKIAHIVVNNTPFPVTTPFIEVAKELRNQSHWSLLIACNDKRVTDVYANVDMLSAIEYLFDLYPEIRKKYEGYHKQPYRND